MSEHYCTYKDGMCELDVDEAYQQGRTEGAAEGRADTIAEFTKVLCDELDKGYIFMNKHQIIHFAEQLKEKSNG